jgi:nucleoside-diphosphate-sugar epimerase
VRVLITGGTGFLGRHAAVRLKRRGDEVAVMGRNDSIGRTLESIGIRYVKSELSDRDRVVAAIEGCDQVIHSGGLAAPFGEYEMFHKANVLGTRFVVEGCRKHGVKRLVYLSTPSLYFNYRDRLGIKESEPLPKAATYYAETKRIADEEIAAAGVPAIGLRPRAIFGPGDQAVLVRLIRAAGQGVMPLVGGGKSYIDLTYIDNVVDALLLSLEAKESALGANYNITNGEPVTAKRMAELVFESLKLPVRFRKVPYPLALTAAGGLETYYRLFKRGKEPPITKYAVGLMAKSQTLDISLAKEKLGYSSKVTLDEGMRRFARWWTRDREGVDPVRRLGIYPPA